MIKPLCVVLLAAFAFVSGFPACAKAGPLEDFNAAVERFNAPYKSAVFYLRTGNAGIAQLELSQAVTEWQAILERFRDAPPPPFDKDAKWGESIGAVTSTLEDAKSGIESDPPKTVRAKLLPIRDWLHDLRSRNGVRVLADCIHELRPAMDTLYAFRRNPGDLSVASVRDELHQAATRYIDKINQCRGEAPEAVGESMDFQTRMKDAAESITMLTGDLEALGQLRAVNAIRALRSHDAFIYLKWG